MSRTGNSAEFFLFGAGGSVVKGVYQYLKSAFLIMQVRYFKIS